MVAVARTEPQKNGAALPKVAAAKKKAPSRVARTVRKTKTSSPTSKARANATKRVRTKIIKARPQRTTKIGTATANEILERALVAGQNEGGAVAKGFVKLCQGWARQLRKTKKVDEPGRQYLDLFVKMIDWLEVQEAAARQLDEIRNAGPRLAPETSPVRK